MMQLMSNAHATELHEISDTFRTFAASLTFCRQVSDGSKDDF